MAVLAAPAAAPADIEASSETHAQLVNQERIIVRTVEATIVVTDVQGSMDRITALARELVQVGVNNPAVHATSTLPW